MDEIRVEAGFASPDEFLAAYDDEISAGGLFLEGFEPGALQQGERCLLVILVGDDQAEAPALVGSVADGVSFLFHEVPPAFAALAERLRGTPGPDPASDSVPASDPVPDSVPDSDSASAPDSVPVPDSASAPDGDAPHASPRGALADRIAALTASQKMSLALAGGREERAALMRDPNRTLQGYVLRNPRIGLDEVQAAAKLTSLLPEALVQIAEHPEWGRNPTICSAVARNPKTPTSLAVKLLDRIPEADVRQIAKGMGRAAIVQAARRKLSL